MLNLQQRTNNSVQLADTTDSVLFLNSDNDLVTKDQNGDIKYVTLSETKPVNRKVYRANISQNFSGAPVATVYENTIGNIVWTRNDVGDYVGTLAGAFVTTNNTTRLNFSIFSSTWNTPLFIEIRRASDDTLSFYVFDDTATPRDLRTIIYIEIYQYPA